MVTFITNFLVSILVFIFVAKGTRGTEEQCKKDCIVSTGRLIGPTRPWHKRDSLGNILSLSRPYPYAFTPERVTLLGFNITIRIWMPEWSYQDSSFTIFHKLVIKKATRQAMSQISTEGVGIVNETLVQRHLDNFYGDITLEIQSIADFNGYNASTTNEFYRELLLPTIQNAVASGILADTFRNFGDKARVANFRRCSIGLVPHFNDASSKDYRILTKLETKRPNPYSRFCDLGCSIFYSATDDPFYLSTCMSICDETTDYNITVEYNDLAEIARLECRDGCHIALRRCQPGYFCTQVKPPGRSVESEATVYGFMSHCPAGTFRDVSYESVEKCVDCPLGRFREDIKGRNLESCTKCPIDTYTPLSSSINNTVSLRRVSIKNCVRCPAGRFTSEGGSGVCKCITSDSCNDEYDAEKRESVPFIGMW
mmetsp:Transcript_32606/g.39628  ORF Transcript_32606/g.39628 Transcript_32606/m.39628 type:complete len:426 (-) Transcript_32606:155-1432(-)